MRPRRPLSILAACFACIVCFPVQTKAQGARDYQNTPVNQLALTLDIIKTKGESAPASGLALPNNLTVSNLIYPFFLWSFPFHGRYGGVSIAPSYSTVEFTGANGTVKSTGFTDPAIGVHLNIFGLPALSREDFAGAIPQNFLTTRFTVTPPLGKYDRNSPVNVGANRWSFTPMVNLNITPDEGVQWFEFYAQGRFFTDNDEYQGSQLLSQEPLVTLSAHYSHNIGPPSFGAWAGIGVNYDYGGETSVNGLAQGNPANGFRPTVSISTLVGPLRVGLRYESTTTRPTDGKRNGMLDLRIAMLLF